MTLSDYNMTLNGYLHAVNAGVDAVKAIFRRVSSPSDLWSSTRSIEAFVAASDAMPTAPGKCAQHVRARPGSEASTCIHFPLQ